MQASGVPFLAGTATPSDVIALLERGITYAKFFPAEVNGGVKALKAFAGPFPQMRFCPTGGIDVAKAPEYLALPNVVCVGGSWMAKPGDWVAAEALAREAAARSNSERSTGAALAAAPDGLTGERHGDAFMMEFTHEGEPIGVPVLLVRLL